MAEVRHPLAVKVLAAAKKYADEGYAEGPNNDTIFGKRYGMNHQPWCAMFVSGCFDDAGIVHLVAASTKKGFASCDAGAQWFAKNKRIVPIGQAQPGDVVFFNFDKTPTDTEQVGIVYRMTERIYIVLKETLQVMQRDHRQMEMAYSLRREPTA